MSSYHMVLSLRFLNNHNYHYISIQSHHYHLYICYVLPFSSKVKISELKVSTNKGYCNKFQIGKCTFGDKCRYRHEIDPDYKKKEEVVVGNNKDNSKDRNKNKDKNNDRKPSKDGHKLYTPNNYNNRVVGPPKTLIE